MTIGIYKITNKKTGQMYIGQSINIERRFKEHIQGIGCPSSYIDNAIQKHGKDYFEFEIIEKLNENIPFLDDILNNREVYYINYYDTFKNNFHYNLTIGGDGTGFGENNPMYGKKHSGETKKKISEANSDENNPNYGNPNNYHHSEETKKKMSESSMKKYARIVKAGKKSNNKQIYAIKYQGKRIKRSISIDKLKKWFLKNYPSEKLHFEI